MEVVALYFFVASHQATDIYCCPVSIAAALMRVAISKKVERLLLRLIIEIIGIVIYNVVYAYVAIV